MIHHWHGGKLALCWGVVLGAIAWVTTLESFFYVLNSSYVTTPERVIGLTVYAVAMIGAPVLLVLTWQWFSIRELHYESSPRPRR